MPKAFDRVRIARKVSRPTSLDYITHIFEDFIEFHGDRNFADDKAIVGGIASLNGVPVTVIGIQKGKTMEENIERNFGSPHPEGYRKALRLMKQAEKFNRPIICFINTSGAYCGVGAEERGQGEAIARNIMEMSRLKTPIISIFTGEGGSGGALALAVADEVWMLEHSLYSVLSPEGFASILWRDSERVEEAAELMKMTANELLKNGVADRMFPEHKDGIENNLNYTTDQIREALRKKLPELVKKETKTLLDERYKRFRKFGEYAE